MIDYQNSYIGKNLNSLSQLGNTLCNGGLDISISGRIGYNCLYKKTPYWERLRKVVDSTFGLIEGSGHCERAYEIDKGENYKLGGSKRSLITLQILVFSICGLLYPIFWIYKKIK